jgi:hypothetical protein
MLSDRELRKTYLLTKEDRYFYLEMYRNPPVKPTELVKRLMWISLTDVVKGAANNYYRRKQLLCRDSSTPYQGMNRYEKVGYEQVEERALILAAHIKNTHPSRGMGWAVSSFKSRFGQLEQRNVLEKRTQVGFGFTIDVNRADEGWDYGTYKGTKPNPVRPTLVDSYKEIQQLVNGIYRKFRKEVTPTELFLIYTSCLKNPTKRSLLSLASRLHSYQIVTMMERAGSFDSYTDKTQEEL